MFLKDTKIQKKISNVLILLFAAVILFHCCVVFGLVPYSIVWGGRLRTIREMYIFELISISLNISFIYIVLIRRGTLHKNLTPKFGRLALLILSVLFSFNTAGNLLAVDSLETILFTPITFLLALLCLLLA
ncbi:hypothetical protein EHQ12_12445 [Leptospira gomenensis]|uniref:Uncharacterized protein n=1 Tax=Leptospira gomenensis TaxID=2484974 RepID=A0A5F1Y9F9_9LEPT|nr:hypothetical protein [Leptospira gomenensis]TGK32742.1 hypothetical protein EHQ17_12290 [Leptospira gomenensis]TGK36889.1 hypothetical protein EHQ12_12445 [Leptospira gomenensis]TGK44361.1 hypothetical protein EHQ07_11760 [Leptospira gomenensis]TGK58854.1 hypothetical protein EHQ13_13580 [Leptospira gomenensis]